MPAAGAATPRPAGVGDDERCAGGPRDSAGAQRTVADLPAIVHGVEGVDGAYIHVPFCFHKCHYCDFYSFVDRDDRQASYVARLIDEIASAASRWTRPVETIFVGGGTPTLLAAGLWRELLGAMRRHLPLAAGGEFTVEANPETVTRELADVLVAGGVNRASIGAQSFDPHQLRTLERWHDPSSVRRAVETFRAAGIDDISIDLIFGIPGETLEKWSHDLDQALSLHTDHLSCYGLTYEPNTAMTSRLRAGEFIPCDDELEAAMLEMTIDRLAAAGFEQYEISNWARRRAPSSARSDPARAARTHRCRHNLGYWRNRDWWAFGPSASAHVQGVRWRNVPRLGDWLATTPWSPVIDVESVDARTRSGELLMLGLRLIDGLEARVVDELLATGADAVERRAAFTRHVDLGLLVRRGGNWALTRRGLLLANEVLVDLV